MARHDYLGDRAANYKLMSDIKNWWHRRGYVVKVWLEKAIDPTSGSAIHVIRTDIKQSIPNARKGYYVD